MMDRYTLAPRNCEKCAREFTPRNSRNVNCPACVNNTDAIPLDQCRYCGRPFERVPLRHYCSPECSVKGRRVLNLAYNREKKRTNLQLIEGQRSCVVCQQLFPLKGKKKYCSQACAHVAQVEQMRLANGMRRLDKATPAPLPPPPLEIDRHQVMGIGGKRRPVMVDNIQAINQVRLESDAPRLEKRGIHSPDHMTMPYSVFDARMRSTYYFSTHKKYLDFIKNHPELCPR